MHEKRGSRRAMTYVPKHDRLLAVLVEGTGIRGNVAWTGSIVHRFSRTCLSTASDWSPSPEKGLASFDDITQIRSALAVLVEQSAIRSCTGSVHRLVLTCPVYRRALPPPIYGLVTIEI